MAANDSKRLLLRSKPKPDESFMGFILRLTELNEYDSPAWIVREAGIGYPHNRSAVAFHKTLDLSALATFTGVDITDLVSLRYPVDKHSHTTYRRLFFGLTVPQYVIRPKHQKVCPGCLLDGSYIRRIWEFALVTVCPIHECLLLDECPDCGKRITWTRNKVAVCPCKYDWREYSPPVVANSDLDVTRQIHLLCHITSGNDDTRQGNLNEPNPLYGVDLQGLTAALLFVARQFARTAYKKGRRLIDTTGKTFARSNQNSETHTLLCKAWSVFNSWPNNYFNFLEWRKTHLPSRRFRAGLNRDFAEYKSALYYRLASEQFNFMREGFEEYLITRWNGGYVGHMRRLSPSLRMRSKYVSRTEAKEFLRIKVEGVDKLIALGRLKAVVSNNGRFRRILIERDSLNTVKQELEQSLYLKQAAARLNVSCHWVRELIKCNLLRPHEGIGIDGRSGQTFNSEDIKCLLDSVRRQLIRGARVAASDNISFLKALRKLRRVNVDIGQFIQIILDGAIRPLGLNSKPGLASLVFSKSRIKGYITELERIRLGETLSVPEVAQRLGIGVTNTRFLISKDIIQISRQAVKGHYDLRISESALDLFNSNYVLPAKLAPQFNTTSSRLTNLLIANGISPISGPKVDGGTQYVFLKKELGQIDLKAIWRASEHEHIDRLNERKLLDVRQAAEILGVEPSDVLDLAGRGILMPHRHVPSSRHKSDGPFFSMFTLEKYKARTIDYSGLVSSTVAAEMLGVSVDILYRYIPKKLLHLAVDYSEASRRYFRLDEVKRLVERRNELRQQCITTAEVASMCKVSKESVHAWVVAGLLQPISRARAAGFVHKLYLRSDIDKLYAEREAFKAKRLSEGRSSRFGRPAGPNWQPVRKKVGPRIEQLVKKWSAKPNRKPVSGQRLRRQLVKEGYRVGINTIYVCLRELRQQASPH